MNRNKKPSFIDIFFQINLTNIIINNNNINGNAFEYYSNGIDTTDAGDNYNNQYHQQLSVNGHQKHGNETANHLMRTSSHQNYQQQQQQKTRYANNSHLTPTPSNHQLAHVINHLSSPESAYSTGYSTDGTSPGMCVTNIVYFEKLSLLRNISFIGFLFPREMEVFPFIWYSNTFYSIRTVV